MSINKVTLLGNVGKQPEIRTMTNGKEVASFSVATSESYKDKNGEKQTKTEWHNIVVFGDGLVGICKNYIHKGDKVYIEGKLQTRQWEDKMGSTHYTTEVVLQGFDTKLLSLVGGTGGTKEVDSHSQAKANAHQPELEDDENETIPF